MAQQLVDRFERKFYYLRLSVTDVCNFRCTYCLPDGYKPSGQKNSSFLTLTEIRRIALAFATSGTQKIRLTGGEPTLRKDFSDIVHVAASTPGIQKVAMTTNGYRMNRVAEWKEAGLTHINVSVDSLDARLFHQITGENRFYQVMKGIDSAFDAGFAQVKVNAVLMKDVNHTQLPAFLDWIKHRPIQLRFIELMQTGDMDHFFTKHHVSGTSIVHYLMANGWILKAKQIDDGPAQVFVHPDFLGEIGLIMPYAKTFCESCNRLRVSARGKLHLCLFGEEGVELRDLLQNDEQLEPLTARLQQALYSKAATHYLHDGNSGATPHLASIGG